MNITIDDITPQIRYYTGSADSPGWGSMPSTDMDGAQYYKGTLMSTYGDRDYATIDFNGTAIYVYGTKRSNHGMYSTRLDGGNEGFVLGYSAENEFNSLIYFQGGLDPGRQHSLTVTNLPSITNPPGNATVRWLLDIDYIVITQAVVGDIYTTVYDDFSPAITYRNFDTFLPNFVGEGYYNNTNHVVYNTSGVVEFPFNGSSVQLFGGLNLDHGNYAVILDGGLNQVYDGYFPTIKPQTSLFFASNLTDGPHHLTVFNRGSPGRTAFDFDYAVVNSSFSPSLGNNATNTTTDRTDGGQSEQTSSGTNVGAIAGGVAGGVVALALLGFLLWCFLIRKKRRQTDGRTKFYGYDAVDLASDPHAHRDQHPASVTPYTETNDTVQHSTNFSSTNNLSSGSMSQVAQHNVTQPGLTSVPPPPPSNATSYPRSDAGYTETSDPYLSLTAASRPRSSIHLPTPTPQHSDRSVPQVQGKQAGVPLPYTAQPVDRPVSAVRSQGLGDSASVRDLERQTVPGRENDAGPVDPNGLDSPGELLPPDYHQATQPLPGQRLIRSIEVKGGLVRWDD